MSGPLTRRAVTGPGESAGLAAPGRDRLPAVVLALSAYIFVVISRVSDEVPSLRLALVIGVVTAVLALLRMNDDAARLFRRREVRLALALLALSAATIPFSAWPGESFRFVTETFVKIVFFFVVVVHTVKSLRAAKVFAWGVLAALLFLEIGLLMYGTGARPSVSNTYDSNDLAFVMVTGFPLAALWALRGRGFPRYLAAAIAMLGVVTVVLSRSRGGFVGLCVVVTLLIVKMPPRHRLAAMVLVLVCVAVVSVVGSQDYWERIGTIWSGGATEDEPDSYDASGVWGARWDVWRTGFELMLGRAVLGVGAGVFDIAEGLSHGGSGKWSAAHNSFLQLGAELGLPGLALFVSLIYLAVRNCGAVVRQARRDPQLDAHGWLAQGVQVGLYGYIITGFCLSQAYAYILYALIGLSVVLDRLASDSARTGQRAETAPPAMNGSAPGRPWWEQAAARAADGATTNGQLPTGG